MLLTINLAVKLSLAADNNQKVCWFFNVSEILSQPWSLLGWTLSPAGCPSWALPDRPGGVTSVVVCPVMSCQRYWPCEMTGICGPALSCYWRLTVILGVLAAFMSYGRLWEGSSLIVQKCLPALPARCQKAPPERGQQKNAIDILLMKDGRAGTSLVCSVLSGVREHYPNLGCYLGSLFCGIATWGLSSRRSLLGLPSSPEVPL